MTFYFLRSTSLRATLKRPFPGEVVISKSKIIMRLSARLPTCNVAPRSPRVCHSGLRVSKNASREVGQKYAVTTFDLGLCMMAYPIIWKSPDVYDDHIVIIGSFHLICAYQKIIGKK